MHSTRTDEPIAKRLRSRTKIADVGRVMNSVETVNVVAKVTLSECVSVDKLLKSCPDAETGEKNWRSANFKSEANPKGRAAVYECGIMMLTGSRTDAESAATAEYFMRVLREVYPDIRIKDYRIVNRTYRFEWDGTFDAPKYKRTVDPSFRYIPYVFVGGTTKGRRTGIHISLFRNKGSALGSACDVADVVADIEEVYRSMRSCIVPAGSEAEKAVNRRFRRSVRASR